jgi:glycerophosphoryl diester phosphodiesterase
MIIPAIILAVIAAIYIFLVAPGGHKKVKIAERGYAHRGFWNSERPENSMSAFRAAKESGFGIETDVQLTKDKIPVLFHDETLTRMCGVDKKVSELTYEELTAYNLADSSEKIPTLTEFLEMIDGSVPLLIELKGVTLNTELCDVLAPMLDGYPGEFVVESFNPFLLCRMKKLRPKIARGQLVTSLNKQGIKEQSFLKNYILAAMLTNFLSRPNFIAYDMHFPNTLAIFMTTKLFGAPKCVWTVNKNDDYVKYLADKKYPIFDRFTPEK